MTDAPSRVAGQRLTPLRGGARLGRRSPILATTTDLDDPASLLYSDASLCISTTVHVQHIGSCDQPGQTPPCALPTAAPRHATALAPAQHDARAGVRRDDHAPPARALHTPTRGVDGHRFRARCAAPSSSPASPECEPGTAPAASPPRQPRLRARLPFQEPLGTELVRFGVYLRIVVQQIDAREQVRRRLVHPPADLDRLLDRAGNREQEHRPVAQAPPGSSPSGSSSPRRRASISSISRSCTLGLCASS